MNNSTKTIFYTVVGGVLTWVIINQLEKAKTNDNDKLPASIDE